MHERASERVKSHEQLTTADDFEKSSVVRGLVCGGYCKNYTLVGSVDITTFGSVARSWDCEF